MTDGKGGWKCGKGLTGAWFYLGVVFRVNPEFRTVTIYVLFIIVEFLVYFYVMGRIAGKYKFYAVTLIELLLFPLYRSGMGNDFTMRASIPALFILMVMCLQYVFEMEDTGEKKKRKVMLICLLTGYLTAFVEIQRNVSQTLVVSQKEYLREDELEASLFYKYLLR